MKDFEERLVNHILSSDQVLDQADLENIVDTFSVFDGSNFFTLPKQDILDKSDQTMRLASDGLYRLPLLSVINGAALVAVEKDKQAGRIKAVHGYAYSTQFADLARKFSFDASVPKGRAISERHFFTHGLLKAAAIKKYGSS